MLVTVQVSELFLNNKPKNMRKIAILFLTFFVLVSTSCSKKDFDPGTTNQPNSSNGWWVTLGLTDGTVLTDHYFFSTYNDAADNKDSMWIDDIEFWPFKGKVALNYSALTFSNPMSLNVYNNSNTPPGGALVQMLMVKSFQKLVIQLLES